MLTPASVFYFYRFNWESKDFFSHLCPPWLRGLHNRKPSALYVEPALAQIYWLKIVQLCRSNEIIVGVFQAFKDNKYNCRMLFINLTKHTAGVPCYKRSVVCFWLNILLMSASQRDVRNRDRPLQLVLWLVSKLFIKHSEKN